MSKSRISSAASIKTNLRQPLDLVGRGKELEEVLDALNPSTRAWIISLTGVGGIGKTELAIKAADSAARKKMFEGIVWTTAKLSWLTHEGIQPYRTKYAFVSLDDLLNTIIEVLQLDQRLLQVSTDRKKDLVKENLRSRSCLLVVDNLETIQEQAVVQFLMELPSPSKALVTTRRGGLKAPDVAPAQTLEGQREIRIGPLSQEDAITLFLRHAKDQGLHFSRKEHAAKLEEVVAKAAYIPLALEWIIGRLALKGDTLDDALKRLHSSNGEVLKYCFESLIATVGSRAQKVLLALSIFVDYVSEETLREVADLPLEKLKEELALLNTASLIEKIGKRYNVLAPTRLYVSSLQQDLSELHQDYHIRAAENYIRLLRDAEQQQRWEGIKDEQQNILSILTWCFDNSQLELAFELARAQSGYLQKAGLWDQKVSVYEIATAAARTSGDRDQAVHFTYEAARIHKARERLDEALEEFQRCEEDSREIGDKQKAAHARMQQGIVLYHKEKYADSIRMLQQSLEMHQNNGDRLVMGQNLNLIGRNELRLGNFEKAQQYFEESLQLKQAIKDQLGIAISQYDLGHLHHRLGNLPTAESLFKESLEILVSLGAKRHQANALWYYALLQIDLGNLEAARNFLSDVIYIEEVLQRDKRLKTANAKLEEVRNALTSSKDAQKKTKLRAWQSSHVMNPTDLVAKAMNILLPYISIGAEEVARHINSPSYEKAKNIQALLQEKWAGDEEARETLSRFSEKPERYKPVLTDILREKLIEDNNLATELSQLLANQGE